MRAPLLQSLLNFCIWTEDEKIKLKSIFKFEYWFTKNFFKENFFYSSWCLNYEKKIIKLSCEKIVNAYDYNYIMATLKQRNCEDKQQCHLTPQSCIAFSYPLLVFHQSYICSFMLCSLLEGPNFDYSQNTIDSIEEAGKLQIMFTLKHTDTVSLLS